MDGILLVEVQVRVDMGVLLVMGVTLSICSWAVGHCPGLPPFYMLPLSCQSHCIGHVRAQGWPTGQRQMFPLEGHCAQMKGEKV